VPGVGQKGVGVKILVADDEPTTRLIAAAALSSLGHECTTVSDGAAAWLAYREERPDVVISDWLMPGLTGPELCRNIRAEPPDRYAYFIMISVLSAPEKVIEGMTAGADDYLVKPLDPEQLELRLVTAARVTALHQQLVEQWTELKQVNLALTTSVRTDPLTGLGNHRALDESLELLDAMASRYGRGYCIAMLDIDQFKSYNDFYGHQAGDLALRTVAGELTRQLRTGDAVYRYGGEEFLWVLPEQSLESGTQAVQRMREAVQRLAIPHHDGPLGVLTVSAGVAAPDPVHTRPANEVLKEADDALYRAKRLGRNRVEYMVEPPR
jgi:two-component system chemotaxis response regulator CheY